MGLNDVRLTSSIGAFQAGSLARNNDGDWNTPLTLMTSATAGMFNLGLGPVAELRFYNVDCDVNALGDLSTTLRIRSIWMSPFRDSHAME